MKRIALPCLFLLAVLEISGQGAITWDATQNIAPSASGNDHPRIVVNASGNPLVVWNHASRCMFSRWNGTAFTPPVMLNPPTMTIAGASWMGPDLAAKGDTVYVVMKQTPEDSPDKHIYITRSFDGGATFSSLYQVDFIADSISRFPTVTIDDAGHPLVAFMKFDPDFGNSRWVVARSQDFGNTFSTDVKSSGWSGGAVCDCCPGALISSGNTVLNPYRDELNDTRVVWVGRSDDNGASFNGGFRADNTGWVINSCPSTGPDGVVIGDTFYSVFMSSASGGARVYLNRSSLGTTPSESTLALKMNLSGLSQQNFPRIDRHGSAVAIAWKQVVSEAHQLPVLFTNNIADGFPAAYDLAANGNTVCTDVALANGKIYVVWEDDNSGTLKFRSGTFTPFTSTGETANDPISIYPNPASGLIHISSPDILDEVRVSDPFGRILHRAAPGTRTFSLNLTETGPVYLQIASNKRTLTRKLILLP